jgi:CRP/FNR family transcriptional regulator, cyclic AMP receptor protein
MHVEQPELFRGLDAEATAKVVLLGRRVTLTPDGVLFTLGDQADEVFIVERGRILLTIPMRFGTRQELVAIEERRPGQIVGWSALIHPHRFTLSARALVDSELLAIPRVALVSHMEQEPSVGYCIARNLASVVGHRLQVFEAMWLREMQRAVAHRYA